VSAAGAKRRATVPSDSPPGKATANVEETEEPDPRTGAEGEDPVLAELALAESVLTPPAT
jgi:hypothetical protein